MENAAGCDDEKGAGSYLHGGVVERDERCEQVKVSSGEHQGKQDLTLSRNTCERQHKVF